MKSHKIITQKNRAKRAKRHSSKRLRQKEDSFFPRPSGIKEAPLKPFPHPFVLF